MQTRTLLTWLLLYCILRTHELRVQQHSQHHIVNRSGNCKYEALELDELGFVCVLHVTTVR